MSCCSADKNIECTVLRETVDAQKQRHQRANAEHERKVVALERIETQLRADMRSLQDTVARQCGELEDSRLLTGRQAEQIVELDGKREAFAVREAASLCMFLPTSCISLLTFLCFWLQRSENEILQLRSKLASREEHIKQLTLELQQALMTSSSDEEQRTRSKELVELRLQVLRHGYIKCVLLQRHF